MRKAQLFSCGFDPKLVLLSMSVLPVTFGFCGTGTVLNNLPGMNTWCQSRVSE